MGVHPTRCGEFEAHPEGPDAYLQALAGVIADGKRDGKVVAVGEAGLDYDRLHFCEAATQRRWFEAQFGLAAAHRLPMFLHLRAAAADFLEIINRHTDDLAAGAVVHSFDGDDAELAQLLQLPQLRVGVNGCYLKTGARPEPAAALVPVPKPVAAAAPARLTPCLGRPPRRCISAEANLRVVAQIPIDRLLLETDAPWCDIRPSHAGAARVRTRLESRDRKRHDPGCLVKGRNEPCNIVQVLEVVAAARGGGDVEALAAQVLRNTEALFFPPPPQELLRT